MRFRKIINILYTSRSSTHPLMHDCPAVSSNLGEEGSEYEKKLADYCNNKDRPSNVKLEPSLTLPNHNQQHQQLQLRRKKCMWQPADTMRIHQVPSSCAALKLCIVPTWIGGVDKCPAKHTHVGKLWVSTRKRHETWEIRIYQIIKKIKAISYQ